MKKKSKYGRNPKLNPKTHCVMVRFDDVEWNRFLTMYEESNVYAKAVFLKAHFFGQKFKVLKVDKTLVDYYTKLSDFHAQFRGIGTNYNQVVKEPVSYTHLDVYKRQVRHHLAILKKICRLAYKEGYADKIHFQHFTLPKQSDKTPRALSRESFEKIRDVEIEPHRKSHILARDRCV